MPESPTPVVAPRKDPKKVDIYSRSQASQLTGQQKGFVYRQYATDPKNPGYVGKKLVAHEIGDQTSGYAMVDAWEIVEPKSVQQGRKSAADTTGNLTGAVTNGDLVWARTTEENFAKYEAIENARLNFRDKAMRGERAGNRLVSTRVVVDAGYAEDGAAERSIPSGEALMNS